MNLNKLTQNKQQLIYPYVNTFKLIVNLTQAGCI
jgi:hypothetical protein